MKYFWHPFHHHVSVELIFVVGRIDCCAASVWFQKQKITQGAETRPRQILKFQYMLSEKFDVREKVVMFRFCDAIVKVLHAVYVKWLSYI